MVTDGLSSTQVISHKSKQATFLATAGAAVLEWAEMAFLFPAIQKSLITICSFTVLSYCININHISTIQSC